MGIASLLFTFTVDDLRQSDDPLMIKQAQSIPDGQAKRSVAGHSARGRARSPGLCLCERASERTPVDRIGLAETERDSFGVRLCYFDYLGRCTCDLVLDHDGVTQGDNLPAMGV